MKKKDREQIDSLKQDIRELKRQQVKWNDFCKLNTQVECGVSIKEDRIQGHVFKFEKYGCYKSKDSILVGYSTMTGYPYFSDSGIINKDIGLFKCEYCGIEMTRKLTSKEKEAIKVLGKN